MLNKENKTYMLRGMFKLFLSFTLLLSLFVVYNAEPNSWQDTSPGMGGGADSVNLFNGKLNFTIPLFEAKGRGSSGFSIPLSIQNDNLIHLVYYQPHTISYGGGGGISANCHTDTTFRSRVYTRSLLGINFTVTKPLTPVTNTVCDTTASYNSGGAIVIELDPYQYHFVARRTSALDPGYGPGVLYGVYDMRSRKEDDSDPNTPPITNLANAGSGRMILTFRQPDGSTQTLFDTNSMGRYKSFDLVNGNYSYPTRGKNFTTIDGSSITFISDTVISDGNPNLSQYSTQEYASILPSGYLITKGGEKYRVENGLIKWIIDNDGNKTVFLYQASTDPNIPNKLIKATDSLGREVNIVYDVNDGTLSPDGTPYGLRDEITYKSLGGTDKKVVVTKTDLGNALRNGLTLKTNSQLWTNISFNSPNDQQIYTKQVISGLWSNGKSTKFKYNSYGELARIEYPTGSAKEYDYEFSVGNGSTDTITRRVIESRIYNSTDNSNLINKTKYSDVYPQRSYTDTSPWTTIPVQIDTYDPSDNLLARSKHYFISDPLGLTQTNLVAKSHGWEDDFTGIEIKTEMINPSDQSIYQRIEYNWKMRVPGYRLDCNQPCAEFEDAPLNEIPSRDPILVETKTTLFENGTNLVSKSSAINPTTGAYAFDEHNNQTDSWVYDYGVGNPGSLLKHSQTSYLNVNPVNGVNYANPNSGQDYTINDPHIIGLPATTKLFDVQPNGSEVLVSQAETRYDESAYPIINAGTAIGWTDPNTTIRGNATTARTWDSTTNSWLETHAQFDNFGNARKAWDAKGNLSEVEFSSTYNYAYPTKTKSVAPDPSGQNGSSVPFETTTTYDFYTGLVLTATDANGQTSSVEYNDPLLRPTKVIPPAGGAQTITEYGDTVGNLFVRTKTQIDATNWAEATAYFDGLGRTFKTQKKDTQGDVFTETIYDNLGRVKSVTNPFRNGETKQWSTTNYDAVGRVKEVIAPDGTKVQSDYGISTVTNFIGTFVVGTDQAGKQGRSITNALGQLVRVDEPDDNGNLGTIDNPTQPTFYNYSPQGQMVRVQQGVQNRYFLYDGLGRLIRVRQPEQDVNANLNLSDPTTGNSQWTAGFTYDANGNLITATDAKNVTITSAYDNANRVLTRTYSDGTPQAFYKYDDPTIQFSKGKLTRVSNAVSASQILAIDNLGRVLASRQTTDGANYDSGYLYNLSGALIEETYPSGRKVRNTLDATGNLTKIETQQSGGSYLMRAQNLAYNSSGAISQLQIGNGLWETAQFNNRLQVTQLGLGNSPTDTSVWRLNYEFGELDTNGNVNQAKNNGNIARQTVTSQAGVLAQSFRYDSLERLKEAKEVSGGNQIWIQNFAYDRYGNRIGQNQTIAGQTSSGTPTVDVNTNRFTAGQGYTYDFAGNIVQDNQGRQFTFNGDNKQVQVKDASNNVIGQYFYDADGKRIKKVTNAETTVFVYSSGKLVAEFTATNSTPTAPSTQYFGTDMLSSTRIITNQNAQVVSRQDFMPFGEDIPNIGGRTEANGYKVNNIRQKFTGYQKDNETGLDFAEARYYNNANGRFTAVDPLLASGKSANPQTFNRYIYSLNSPLILSDPSGMQSGSRLGGVNPTGSWYKPKDGNGDVKYVKYEDPVPSGYELITQTNRWSGGTPVYAGVGLDEFHAVRLHPNGPMKSSPTIDVRTGQKGFTYLSDFQRKGWEIIWSDKIIDPHPGLEDVSLDLALTVIPAAQGAKGLFTVGADAFSNYAASRAASRTLAGFGSDEIVAESVANLTPKKGWYDAVIHGDSSGLYFTDKGNSISASKLYEMMLKDGYQPGTNIRLVSCWSGSCENGAAQQLANLSGGKVRAPTGMIEVFGPTNPALFGSRAQFKITGASENFQRNVWRTFSPKK